MQEKEAIEVKREIEAQGGEKIYTEIMPLKNFYLAEGYHQKYYLQNTTKLYKELKTMYNTFGELISSTLTARVNGYIAGSISLSALKEELKLVEISEENYNKIINIINEIR